jgi:5'-3' exonuclease
MTKPTLLIDGDILLYESTSSNEVECDWGDDLWTLHTDLGECRKTLQKKMDRLLNTFQTDSFVFAISDMTNFRKEVLPSYKAHRRKVRKPVAYQALKNWAIGEYPCEVWPNLEGDDVIGILATSGVKHPAQGPFVIVSEDKDLKTIPGVLYRQEVRHEIDQGQADYFWLYQTLCGDPTDGYKGCPGIADKKAAKLLEPFCHETKHDAFFDLPGAWAAVVEAYEKAGQTVDDAITQARCARILRASDWDFNTQTVKLWTP